MSRRERFVEALNPVPTFSTDIPSSNLRLTEEIVPHKCVPHQDSPTLVSLHTKLRIYYDGGQWFHMAENFLVQHAILSQKDELLQAKHVYYNFDQTGFLSSLNSFTRLVVYLGSIAPGYLPASMSFLENTRLQTVLDRDDIEPGEGILVPVSALKESQTLALSRDVTTDKRFTKVYHDSTTQSSPSKPVFPFSSTFRKLWGTSSMGGETEMTPVVDKSKVCMRYAGSIGGQFVERADWFAKPADIRSLRQKITDACPRNQTLLSQFTKKHSYKLVLYQRNRSRRLLDSANVLAQLRDQLKNQQQSMPDSSSPSQQQPSLTLQRDDKQWDIMEVMHDNDRSPCELAHILHDADVVITPHGFQAMLMLFMPQPALFYEIFPAPYYKHVYQTLSTGLGLSYGSLSSEPTDPLIRLVQSYVPSLVNPKICNHWYFCRAWARGQDVKVSEEQLHEIASTIQQHIALFRPPALTVTSPFEVADDQANSRSNLDGSRKNNSNNDGVVFEKDTTAKAGSDVAAAYSTKEPRYQPATRQFLYY